MAQETILLPTGAAPPSGGSRGDSLREAHAKINRNFAELYDHAADLGNPHQTTAAQVGAVPVTALGVTVATLSGGRLTASQAPNLTFTGDATGTGSNSIALTLSDTGIVAGTYRSVEVDSKGRVIAGALVAGLEGLQEVTDRGATTSNPINITSADNVAFTVAGGASLGGNLFVGAEAGIRGGALHLAMPNPGDIPGNWTLRTEGSGDADLVVWVVRPTGVGTEVARLTGDGNVLLSGTLTVTGDLVVNGSSSTVNSTTVTVDDPAIFLGGDTPPALPDGMDRGVAFRWHDGSASKLGFFGFDGANSSFKFIPEATETSANVFDGPLGVIRANLTGNAETADRWTNARTLTLSGAVVGSAVVDGSADIPITTTYVRGAVMATYNQVVVSSNGFVLSGTSRTLAAGQGITLTDSPLSTTIALQSSGVTAGTYRRVTVNPLGQVTSGDNPSLTFSEVVAALGYTPVDRAGDTMTGNLVVAPASGSFTQVVLRAPAGQFRYVRTSTGVTPRWDFGANTAPEAGGNTGSDFYIRRFDDGGGVIGDPLTISRNTGVVTVGTLVATAISVAGLNAETLDGLDSSEFARRGAFSGSLADFNALPSVAGIYQIDRGVVPNLNAPDNAANQQVLHMAGVGARGAQLAISSFSPFLDRLYLRTLRAPSWGPWFEVWSEARIAEGAPAGFLVRPSAGTFLPRAITAGAGITVSNGDGVAANPTIALTALNSAGTYRQVVVNAFGQVTSGAFPDDRFTLTGDVLAVGAPGSLVPATLANTGVVAGTYTQVAVDAKGRVLAGSNPAFLTAEVDTLASVTARGSNTSSQVGIGPRLTVLGDGSNNFWIRARNGAENLGGGQANAIGIQMDSGASAVQSVIFAAGGVVVSRVVPTALMPELDNTYDLGTPTQRWRQIYGTVTAVYADLAERYAASEPLEPGDVVEIGGEAEVRKTSWEASRDVFGVVSTSPAVRLNDAAGDDRTHPFIALSGRVPCKVIGPIRKGQRLVASSIPGVARAATVDDPIFAIFGRALESLPYGEQRKIEIAMTGAR